jgi:hypothetical protein
MWLMADYLPEVASMDLRIFPPPEQLAEWLGDEVRIEKLPIPRDTPDWQLGSFWAHPERVLDANARAATSGFARMPTNVVNRVVSEVSRDLASGEWDERYGHLRKLNALDVGLRLVVSGSNWFGGIQCMAHWWFDDSDRERHGRNMGGAKAAIPGVS